MSNQEDRMKGKRPRVSSSQIKWGDLPPDTCRKPTKYQLILQALSERPGEWAELGRGASPGELNAVRKRLNIVSHLHGCSVEVTCRRIAKGRGVRAVWARWLGGPRLHFGGKSPKLTWRDPPKGKNKYANPVNTGNKYIAIAEALMARPGEWARIHGPRPTRSKAYNGIQGIRPAVARLGGRVETSVRCTADGFEAWARCIPQGES